MLSESTELESLIKSSGNEFHFEVAGFLRGLGWTVVVSPYYVDGLSDKPREIDIIATKYIPGSSDIMYGRNPVEVRLFIECKYVAGITAFWFDSIDANARASKLVEEYGLGSHAPTGKDRDPYMRNLLTYNHYLKNDSVAKLTATSKNPEQDFIYKALNQCLNSMLYFRKNVIPGSVQKAQAYGSLNIPIIVCESFNKFYSANTRTKLSEGFLLEVNYAHKSISTNQEYFLVDILAFNKNSLTQFLQGLEAEARQLGSQLLESQY